MALGLAATLVACGGGGKSSSAVPSSVSTPTPTPAPLPSPGAAGTPNPVAFVCPTSDTASSTVRTASVAGEGARHPFSRGRRSAASAAAPNLIAVSYQRSVATSSTTAIATKERSLGATLVRTYDFPATSVVTRVVSVPAASAGSVESALRAQAGVTQVGLTGERRYSTSITTPYFTNDPYFAGFASAGTFEVGPYEEAASVPGQWDMHVIGLEKAFAYSQNGNGSGITNANALGSSSVKIAIIDTGEDVTHPELGASKVPYQRCFITNPSSNVQSNSYYTTDPLGHGTDVAGIAAANDNNALGFTGAGGKVVIYGYRVFPTPDDNCTSDTTTDSQCGSDTGDIAAAIYDAISKGVNVISMSLGGGGCTSSGADTDATEGAAVAAAIAANIVVVAAAGNDGSAPLEAPACDSGVIAVGASALGDGQLNGSGTTVTGEYVASYSDWGTPAASPRSASAWGIVAPGGDPEGACTTVSNCDADDLHWVENIWTSQPYDSSFAGGCYNDFPNSSSSSAPDCRTQIAGTSMATPHVAGVAALIISANAIYQNPTMMKQLLCTTADDISDSHEGCGRLNAYRAMATALRDPSLP